MPMQSKVQNAAMHAAAAGKSNIGIPASVGKKFVAAQHGHPLPKGTPKRKGPRQEKHKPPTGKTSPFALARSKRRPPAAAAMAAQADDQAGLA